MVPPLPSNSNTIGQGGLTNEINYAIEAMKQLKVSELKELCRSINLPLSGRKVNLQERLTQFIKDSMSIGHIDPWRPKSIVLLIQRLYQSKELPPYFEVWSDVKSGKYPIPIVRILGDSMINTQSQSQTPTTTNTSNTTNSTQTNKNNNRTKTSSSSNNRKLTNDSVPFKLSPFYNIQTQIPKSSYRLVKAPGRGVGAVRFTFTGHEWLKLQSDTKKYRLYLFCWPANSPYHSNSNNYYQHKEFIAFPSPNEILFNGIKITENVRGLKNKPGTAKPADLTTHIRPPPQVNTLDLVYAYTTIDYQMACYITEFISPEELLQNVVLKHPRISKKSTLNYIKKIMNEEDEDELITTSTVLSLQCPISYTRMKYPAQSRLCQHLQCFDALWYLHSQLQVPTWQCPVCSITIPLENLVICEYVDDILKNSDEEVEQVELSSDGSWKPFIEEEIPVRQRDDKQHQVNEQEEASPVKKEASNDIFTGNNHGNTNSHEVVVISLDSSEDEDGGEEKQEQLPTQTATTQDASNLAPPTSTEISQGVTTSGSSKDINETTESDLPLSQYRTISTNSLNTPTPSLTSESLLGLGNSSQTPQRDMNLSINPNNPRLPPVSPAPPSFIPSTTQFSVPSIPLNVSVNRTSSLFKPGNPIQLSPLINSNSSNNILGIGGNLPTLNLSQNVQQPLVNPFLSNTNTNNNNVYIPFIMNNSTNPSSPATNVFPRNDNETLNTTTMSIPTDTNRRPIAVPHPKNHNSRRSRTEVSVFIPRKQFPPPPNIIPKKRPNINENEPMKRKDTLPHNNSNVTINPITNHPYQNGVPNNNNKNMCNVPNSSFSISQNSNVSDSSDIIDLTSD